MMRVLAAFGLCLMCSLRALPVAAQQDQTLADIRQELNVLYVEVQKLKRELSTTGAPQIASGGDSVLDRVGAIESELQRLTAKTEQLEHRIGRVVEDGTNRIGDLEFRLVELEGGDVSKLGETTTLGGDMGAPAAPSVPEPAATGGGELAMGEQADFDAAQAALEARDYQRAATLFDAFNQSYPGSPMAPRAYLAQGRALDGLGDTREAARAYLTAFTGDDTGPTAPAALYELGAALGRLGQVDQACVTLGEVGVRFPGDEAAALARSEMSSLGCN
ncbi:tol-pal system protein YbgF [Aquicoccus sp. SU-CL01552]|uniref:tol-pal system protein YbgF n=1 Tax=Aquicoccus sp. SU-CL01552 TaxID=3127656 RepID=UPI00310955D8